jgi:hypothetical protein
MKVRNGCRQMNILSETKACSVSSKLSLGNLKETSVFRKILLDTERNPPDTRPWRPGNEGELGGLCWFMTLIVDAGIHSVE